MNSDRELMQQALEALEEARTSILGWGSYASEYFQRKHGLQRDADALNPAIDALRDVLAQQEQSEPVAWMVYTLDGKSVCVTDNPADFTDQHRALPLYTTPPRREWQGLTDEEIRRIGNKTPGQQGGWNLAFARALEQALKEKNA